MLTKVFNTRGQVNLIEYSSMPGGKYKCFVGCKENGAKFGWVEEL